MSVQVLKPESSEPITPDGGETVTVQAEWRILESDHKRFLLKLN